MRLAKLDLILKLNLVKNYKCYVCVQSKQPHKVVEASNLVPLDLIYFDLCEMNRILTNVDKHYFITFIVDSTVFCIVYLLKSKDEVLYSFKTYKAKVENQLERKIKRLR